MATAVELNGDTVGLGRGGFHALRRALQDHLGEEATTTLQAAGHASGADLYRCFLRWLEAGTGIADPGELDANALSEVLGDFFSALGWGRLSLNRLGTASLALDTENGIEADPANPSPYPSCHLTAGLLAGFMSSLAQQEVAVMEVECRSTHHSRCRFLVGRAETLDAVYQALSEGRDYASVLGVA
jgi:predicted hydrocarbon binding protein